MAQGTHKLKSKANSLKKEKNRVKKQQMKKGARYIAPKKAKHLQADKLKKLMKSEDGYSDSKQSDLLLAFRQISKTDIFSSGQKGLEKAIKTNIENEITQKVKAIEPKSFKIVKPSDSETPSSSNPSTSVQSKQK